VIPGPAIIAEQNATTVVEPGWEATLTALDHLVLERRSARNVTYAAAPPPTRCCWRCSTTCS
jgi:5-oxoprolinase (ATP-hydrolysing)